jgi:uncharacterized hydrophobic protein (TIGR00271 family)
VREFHLVVDEPRLESVERVLGDGGIDYTTVTDGDERHLFFALPTPGVESVLDDLAAVGVDEDAYAVMSKAEYVSTPNTSSLQERYAGWLRNLSTQELHGKIREIQWPYQLYYLGTVLSVIAATAGLLVDQPALVIGAMIIAPQASSGLAAPAGVLLGDWDLFTTSIREQVLSLTLAVVAAALFAAGLRAGGFVAPGLDVSGLELASLRLSPTFLSTVGAGVAGIVGAFGYTTEQSTSLVGVMIAAALVPAAAAAGLAAAWGDPVFGVGALLLLAVNVLAINLGAFVTLLAMGYRPTWREDRSLSTAVPEGRRVVVGLFLLGVVLATVVTGALTAANVGYSQSVTTSTQETLDRPAYGDLTLRTVQSGFGGVAVPGGTPTVTVSVTRPPGESYPRLPARLERTIEEETDRDVRVEVAFSTAHSVDEQAASERSATTRRSVASERSATTRRSVASQRSAVDRPAQMSASTAV